MRKAEDEALECRTHAQPTQHQTADIPMGPTRRLGPNHPNTTAAAP
jgi:hypothetical protein